MRHTEGRSAQYQQEGGSGPLDNRTLLLVLIGGVLFLIVIGLTNLISVMLVPFTYLLYAMVGSGLVGGGVKIYAIYIKVRLDHLYLRQAEHTMIMEKREVALREQEIALGLELRKIEATERLYADERGNYPFVKHENEWIQLADTRKSGTLFLADRSTMFEESKQATIDLEDMEVEENVYGPPEPYDLKEWVDRGEVK